MSPLSKHDTRLPSCSSPNPSKYFRLTLALKRLTRCSVQPHTRSTTHSLRVTFGYAHDDIQRVSRQPLELLSVFRPASCLTEVICTSRNELFSYQVALGVNTEWTCITGANRIRTGCQIWHLCQWFATHAVEVGLRTA